MCLHISNDSFLLNLHVDVSPAATSTIARLSSPFSAVLPGHERSFAHLQAALIAELIPLL